jgi:hypothetical protein
MEMMDLHNTFHSARREHATDARGLPASYTRAVAGLTKTCTYCSQRATFVNGDGVGTCARHRDERRTAIQERDRCRRQIDAAREWRLR